MQKKQCQLLPQKDACSNRTSPKKTSDTRNPSSPDKELIETIKESIGRLLQYHPAIFHHKNTWADRTKQHRNPSKGFTPKIKTTTLVRRTPDLAKSKDDHFHLKKDPLQAQSLSNRCHKVQRQRPHLVANGSRINEKK